MRECLTALMDKVGAVYGFTQSDEMALLVPPAPVVRGVQQQHASNSPHAATARQDGGGSPLLLFPPCLLPGETTIIY